MKKMSRSEGDGTPWSGNLGDEYDWPNDSVMHVKHYVHDRYDYRFITCTYSPK